MMGWPWNEESWQSLRLFILSPQIPQSRHNGWRLIAMSQGRVSVKRWLRELSSPLTSFPLSFPPFLPPLFLPSCALSEVLLTVDPVPISALCEAFPDAPLTPNTIKWARLCVSIKWRQYFQLSSLLVGCECVFPSHWTLNTQRVACAHLLHPSSLVPWLGAAHAEGIFFKMFVNLNICGDFANQECFWNFNFLAN